jgi:hypothetical protein
MQQQRASMALAHFFLLLSLTTSHHNTEINEYVQTAEARLDLDNFRYHPPSPPSTVFGGPVNQQKKEAFADCVSLKD